jgi:hypothetical protein
LLPLECSLIGHQRERGCEERGCAGGLLLLWGLRKGFM